jgi:transcriptional regulator with XRE-family HTH domain
VRSLVEQLRRARESRGDTVQQLLERSGLDLERSVLHRKLRGESLITATECEALAQALDITLRYPNQLDPLEPPVKRPRKRKRRAS